MLNSIQQSAGSWQLKPLKNEGRGAWRVVFILFFLALSTSCSTAPTTGQSQSLPPKHLEINSNFEAQAQDSSVEIQYSLGRDRYRFSALAHGDLVTASTYLGKQVLEHGTIKRDRYPHFLKKASAFIESYQQGTSPSQTPCRSPFIVMVRIGNETQIARGCRSSDNGTFSKLVKDGEFLLYSKN